MRENKACLATTNLMDVRLKGVANKTNTFFFKKERIGFVSS